MKFFKAKVKNIWNLGIKLTNVEELSIANIPEKIINKMEGSPDLWGFKFSGTEYEFYKLLKEKTDSELTGFSFYYCNGSGDCWFVPNDNYYFKRTTADYEGLIAVGI